MSPDSRRASQLRLRGWLYLKITKRLRLDLGYGRLVSCQRFQRGDDRTGVRLRNQLRLEIPIVRDGPAIALWSEPFVNLARTRLANERLDRVRNFAGLLVPAGRRMSVEIGYLKQYQPQPAGALWIDAVPVIVAFRF